MSMDNDFPPQYNRTSRDNDSPPPYQPQDPMATTARSNQRVKSMFYHIYRSHFGNYKIDLHDTTPAFYAESRRVRTPDLIIHLGSGDLNREVAHCKYPEYGNHYDIGLFREPNNKSSLTWTQMTSDCRFIATVPVPDLTSGSMTNLSVQRTFTWKRMSSSMLVDDETGLAAAVVHDIAFASAKCCVLEIRVPYGKGFNLLVVTTLLALYEKQRRQYAGGSGGSRRRRAAGAAAATIQGGIAGAGGV